MILAWMVYATLFATLLGGTAVLLERALRLVGREARWAWATVAMAAVGVPSALAALRTLGLAVVQLPPLVIGARRASLDGVFGRIAGVPTGSLLVDRIALACWMVAAGCALAMLASSMRRLAERRRAWVPDRVDDTPVLVADDAGPAVVGVRRPEIVIPRWVLDLEEPLRRLVLLHEREHVREGDSRLLFAAALAVALAPWNPALWWIRRRLRGAIEVDCDARVLRREPDPRRYGALLILVGQRTSPQAAPMPALIEPSSILVRRLHTMSASFPRHRRLRAAALGGGALLLLAIACEAPTPSADVPPPPPPPTAARVDPGVMTEADIRADGARGDRLAQLVENGPTPRYPDILRQAGIEGEVVAQFIVDRDGRIDVRSLKILRTTELGFAEALRLALPQMRYTPAVKDGRPVRQLVTTPFVFKLAR